MPVASLANLQWNGPGSAASFGADNLATVTADIKAWAQPDGALTGAGVVSNADATRLKHSPATLTGLGQIVQALPNGRARPTTEILIGGRPTADDIAQAVWGSPKLINTEDGTMAVALRLVEAILRNRQVTDPSTGTVTVYDDDNATDLLMADLFADAAGTTPYDGSGAERRDRLE